MTVEARPVRSITKRADGVRLAIPLAVKLMEYIERGSFSKITITGDNNLDQVRQDIGNGRKVVFASNHVSHADGPAIYAGLLWNGYADLAEKLVFLAGIRMDKLPTTGFLQRRAKTIQVWPPTEIPKNERDERKRAEINFKAIRAAKNVLETGGIIGIFPQSTRSEAGKGMGKAFPEVSGYLKDSYVVPIGVVGTDKVLARGQLIPTRGDVTLNIGPLIDMKKYSDSLSGGNVTPDQRRRLIVDTVMLAIARQLPPQYRGEYR